MVFGVRVCRIFVLFPTTYMAEWNASGKSVLTCGKLHGLENVYLLQNRAHAKTAAFP